MPDDEVQFYFELTDNDVPGLKKLPQNVFAKVPSLADLYTETEILESIIEDLKEELDNVNDLKNELKDIKLQTLKSDKLSWNKAPINNSIEKVKAELKNLKKFLNQSKLYQSKRKSMICSLKIC